MTYILSARSQMTSNIFNEVFSVSFIHYFLIEDSCLFEIRILMFLLRSSQLSANFISVPFILWIFLRTSKRVRLIIV